ncbi:MAG: tRNA dimethylallyltransferase [Miltoncostaeaceae bacterium]|nr:tRNA dimethylallyltransferase [Miltoncostaeaceae bacterium]
MLALFGPTAAGKSALAHAAALALGGEIVVCDPFQRYRGLEIAADSPRPAALAEVPHHLVGDLSLEQGSTAGSFARLAHEAVDGALARGRVPVVAGGTGLYLRAALADLRFPAPAPAPLRERAERLAADDPASALAALAALDPAAAARVDRSNPRRLARALERVEGGAGGEVDRLWSAPPRHPTLLVGVVRPRPLLDRLIAERVRRELDDGLLAEIEAALDHPGGLSREAAQVIGVREALALRRGEIEADALQPALAARTRRLARKQLTWLRKTPDAVILDLGEAPAEAALPRLLELWQRAGETTEFARVPRA